MSIFDASNSLQCYTICPALIMEWVKKLLIDQDIGTDDYILRRCDSGFSTISKSSSSFFSTDSDL